MSTLVFAGSPVTKALEEPIGELKEDSKTSYKRLHAGFEFKGYAQSPGHQAILKQMQQYYKSVILLEKRSKVESKFPIDGVKHLEKSLEKVKHLAGFVVMEKETKGLLDQWVKRASEFHQATHALVQLHKKNKVEKETKKVEQAILLEKAKRQLEQDEKEARLNALKEHYRLMRKQNRAIIRAGYTTPRVYYPQSTHGYYYNNGTFYPRTDRCNTYHRKPRVQIIYKK